MKRFVLLLLSLAGCTAGLCAPVQADYYVAPTGNITNPGTFTQPLASLAQARDLLRAGTPEHNVTVLVRGGVYLLEEPLVFGAEDSGSNNGKITYKAYPGEKPILSGGRRITGWQKAAALPGLAMAAKGKVWVASVVRSWLFHALYINGQPQPRAVQPNTDDWQTWPRLTGSEPPTGDTQVLTFSRHALEGVPGNGDAEICLLPNWRDMNELAVLTDVNSERNTAVRRTNNLTYAAKTGDPYRLENCLAALDQPGEWCVDSAAGKVYYWPPSGSMAKVEAVAPVTDCLLRLDGGEENDQRVRNLEFIGFTFTHADRLPETAWPEEWRRRGFTNPGAAVALHNAENCLIADCRFVNLGACSLRLDADCTGNRVIRNEFAHLGGEGIRLNGTPKEQLNNTIAQNYLHHLGETYWRSPAIALFAANGNKISGNYIRNVSFCGIWLSGKSHGELATGNRIEYNQLVDTMGKLQGDGALSCLNCGDGNAWRGNLVRYTDPARIGYFVYVNWVTGGEFTGNAAWMSSPLQPVYQGTNMSQWTYCMPNLRSAQNADEVAKYAMKVPFTWRGNRVADTRSYAYDQLSREILNAVVPDGGWPPATPQPDPAAPLPVPTAPERWLTGVDYAELHGLYIEMDGAVCYSESDRWACLGLYDFTRGPVAAIDVCLASTPQNGKQLQLRRDATDGPLLGVISPHTAGDIPRLYRVIMPALTGPHAIYLTFDGPVGNITKLRFVVAKPFGN